MRGAVPVYTFSARQEVVLVEETKMVKAGLLLLKMLNKGGGGGGVVVAYRWNYEQTLKFKKVNINYTEILNSE